MNTTILIPIHEFNETIGDYLLKALTSIDTQKDAIKPKIMLVIAHNIITEVNDFIDKNYHNEINIIVNDAKTDYQSQVNLGVKQVSTEYFSVLEFDDEYSSTYFKNVDKYINNYPDIDIFLTLLIEVNEKNEGIKLTNETVWAQQFIGENGEMGYLNIKALKQYTDFKLSGAVIKKSDFENLGGYKSNIKLTFMYEFLLRALNNASKIYSIPKIGYKHLATRENSLFDNYLKNMSINERKFWFETATKESNFMNDRPIELSKTLQVIEK